MSSFKLTDNQVEAILNMRLRSLHKLEEIEIQTEHDKLSKERDELEKLIKSEAKQWARIKKQVGDIKEMFGPKTKLGKRRTEIGKAVELVAIEELTEALIEKEPITVVFSDKGWIRGMKGHGLNPKDLKYKDGDKGAFVLEAQTTDKILLFGTNGRFYTIAGDKLPSGRGFGEPIRLIVDLPNDADIVTLMTYEAGTRLLVASTEGHGFIVKSEDVLAQTKGGKQILNVDGTSEASICFPVAADHDHVAVLGKSRKLLVFEIAEVPEMSRGKGVLLQKSEGGVSDAKTFNMQKGLEYRYGGGTSTVDKIKLWLGKRAQAGKLPPNGFPSNRKF